MNLVSFQPLLDLLQAQYGSTSEVNNQKFSHIDIETAIELLLVPDEESPTILPPMRMNEVTEINAEIQKQVDEVKEHYQAKLDEPNNHETCLALGEFFCFFTKFENTDYIMRSTEPIFCT